MVKWAAWAVGPWQPHRNPTHFQAEKGNAPESGPREARKKQKNALGKTPHSEWG